MSSIFLAHSSQDKQFVRRLAEDLKQVGYRVWVDEAEIKIGDSLIEKIQEGLESSRYVGAVISVNSINSQWVKKELSVAMIMEIKHEKVKVLPLLLNDLELPALLSDKKFADFRKEEVYKKSLEDLMRTLGNPFALRLLSKKELMCYVTRLQVLRKMISLTEKEKERLKKRLINVHPKKILAKKVKDEIVECKLLYSQFYDVAAAFSFMGPLKGEAPVVF